MERNYNSALDLLLPRCLTLVGVVVLIFFGGCSSFRQNSGIPLSEVATSQETLLALSSTLQDTSFDCGLACLVSVLRYWDHAVSLKDLLKTDPPQDSKSGYTLAELKEIAQSRGLNSVVLQGRLEFLKEQVSKGRPVICLLPKEQGGWNIHFNGVSILPDVPGNHFMVVMGFSKSHLVLMNPESGLERMKVDSFLMMWNKTKNTLLLVAPVETQVSG